MAQAIPWNVRGIDPDVRNAALEAARRSGLTLGEWLNSVIGETIAAHDTHGDHPEAEDEQHSLPLPPVEDPLDQVARRIARLNERGSSAALAATGALSQPNDLERVAKIIESAVETMDRSAREREAKTAAALDAMADVLERQGAAEKPAARLPELKAADLPRPVSMKPAAEARTPARRWNDPPEGDAGLPGAEALRAGNPVRQMIERIENRLDAISEQAQTPKVEASLRELDRRLQDIARKIEKPATAAGAGQPSGEENIRRIEGKLSAILDTLNQQTLNTLRASAAEPARRFEVPVPPIAAPAPMPSAPPPAFMAPSSVRGAIDDITLRQRDLDEGRESPRRRAAYAAARPPEPQIDDLKQQLQRLSDKIGQNGAQSAASQQIEQLRSEIAGVSHAIEDLAPRHVVVSIEGAIRDLATRIEQTRDVGVKAQQLAPVEKLLVDLRIAVESLRESSAIDVLRGDLKALSDRIGASTASRGGDREALQALSEQMADLRQLVLRAQEPVALEGLEHRIMSLSDKLERIADRPQDSQATAGLASAVADVRNTLQHALPTELLARIEKRIGDLGRIEAHLSEIAAHMQDVPGRADIDALHARMDRMHTTLLERPAPVESGISSHDLSAIQAMLLNLSDKIDTAHNNNDEHSLATLQMQLARISERLESGGTPGASGTLDRSLKDLVSQLDGLRQSTIDAAETAARNAVRESGAQQPGFDAIARDLASLRHAQSEADHRTQLTLSAVNDALAKVVGRLGQLETDSGSPAAPAREPAAGEAAYRVAGKGSAAPARPTLVAAERVAALDTPIEPGAGRPGSGGARPVASVDANAAPDGKAAFIAAARRAAKAAEEQAAGALQAHRAATDAPEGRTSSLRSTLTARRTPIMIGIAAALVGLVALQAFHAMRGGQAPIAKDAPRVSPAPAEAAPEKQSMATPAPKQKLAVAPLSSSFQAADPQHVGSIDTQPKPPAAADSGQPLPISAKQLTELSQLAAPITSERLRAGLQSGDPLALHEIGVRFMEGRNVPRDPAIGAKFLEASAQLGLAPAQYRVGSLYREGRGVPADKAKALEWFRMAANNGNARAMHNVGVLLAEGVAGVPDYSGAAEWFTRASDLNVRDSQYNLAILYARGLGVAQDLGASYKWFSAAATQGDADAGKKRDDVAGRMSPEQLTAAKAAVAAWHPLPLDPAANDVSDPPGGWEAPLKPTDKAPDAKQDKVSDKRKGKSV